MPKKKSPYKPGKAHLAPKPTQKSANPVGRPKKLLTTDMAKEPDLPTKPLSLGRPKPKVKVRSTKLITS